MGIVLSLGMISHRIFFDENIFNHETTKENCFLSSFDETAIKTIPTSHSDPFGLSYVLQTTPFKHTK